MSFSTHTQFFVLFTVIKVNNSIYNNLLVMYFVFFGFYQDFGFCVKKNKSNTETDPESSCCGHSDGEIRSPLVEMKVNSRVKLHSILMFVCLLFVLNIMSISSTGWILFSIG